MRVVCPRCAARYDVPDERMLPGRAMRCARCGTDWVPDLVEPTPAARPHPFKAQAVRPVSEVPAEAPVGGEPTPVRPPARRPVALAIAWAGSVGVLAGAGWGVMAHRSAVEQAWPASARLFAWLGVN